MRYSIGDFSRLTRLSVKALRLYHEEGILLPSAVDRASGYRYYDEGCLERARVVSRLRELEFSLKEIAEIVGFCSDDSQLAPHLQRKESEIAGRIQRLSRTQEVLRSLMRQEREHDALQGAAGVVRRDLPDLLIAGLRFRGRYSEVGRHLERLGRVVGRRFRGPVLSLYHDGEFKEEGADIEVAMGVRRPVAGDGVESRVLPGGPAVTLLHYGPYETLHLSYKRIFDFISAAGLATRPPGREVYRRGPGVVFRGNPKKYVTEIQLPVSPEPARRRDGNDTR